MSYTPTQWKDGDLVTSAKLNKMEQGIAAGGGILIVNIIQENQSAPSVLDKTWQEIHDADIRYVINHNNNISTSCPILSTKRANENEYQVFIITNFGLLQAIAETSDDYPIIQGLVDNPNDDSSTS